MDNLLQLKIISPREVVLEEPVFSVSSINSAGKFDILPEHANFITMVEDKPITVHKKNDEKVNFQFPLAIIYVTKNQCVIYSDIEQHLF